MKKRMIKTKIGDITFHSLPVPMFSGNKEIIMAKRMKVYVAGPYSSDNVLGVLSNIRKGNRWAYQLLQQGFAPFSPWLDYHFVLEDHSNDLTVQDFYEYSMEWLRVSDAVFVQGNWQLSKGTLAEIKEAESLGIPVFYDLTKLIIHARGKGFEV